MKGGLVVAMTAGAIVQVAFQTFLKLETEKTGDNKVAELFSEKELTQMAELRQKIWGRLRFKSRKMQALANVVRDTQQVSLAQMDEIVSYLQIEMDYDERFASEVKRLAERIYQELKGESQAQPFYSKPVPSAAQPGSMPAFAIAVTQR